MYKRRIRALQQTAKRCLRYSPEEQKIQSQLLLSQLTGCGRGAHGACHVALLLRQTRNLLPAFQHISGAFQYSKDRLKSIKVSRAGHVAKPFAQDDLATRQRYPADVSHATTTDKYPKPVIHPAFSTIIGNVMQCEAYGTSPSVGRELRAQQVQCRGHLGHHRLQES